MSGLVCRRGLTSRLILEGRPAMGKSQDDVISDDNVRMREAGLPSSPVAARRASHWFRAPGRARRLSTHLVDPG